MSIWTWIAKIFHGLKVSVAPMVVSILELIQGAEQTGLLPGLAKIIDGATGHLAGDIDNILKTEVQKGIILFLGIEGLPANPTQEEEKAFEQKVFDAFNAKKLLQTVPGQVATDLAFQLHTLITKIVAEHADGSAVTKAEIIGAIEEFYQDLQADIAQANNDQETSDVE